MIKNSYQIFNCNEIDSQFKLLSLTDSSTQTRINKELEDYHKLNEFDIQFEDKNINQQNIINNKFIFKNGYYFCSYLYKENEDIYISEPIFETPKNPICSINSFTNIIIKNRIPLNLKIIGAIYYYKPLLDKTECRTNMLYEEEKVVTHEEKDKYVIDIVYFNSIINNINYELNYVYYKNISYVDFKKPKFKKNLRYYYFDKAEDTNLKTLTTRLETKIYNETNTIILNINNTTKKQSILKNLKNIVFSNTNNNNLLTLLTKISEKNTNDISDFENNEYSNHLVNINKILIEIENIKKKLTQFITYKVNVQTIYKNIFNELYTLQDFSQMLAEPSSNLEFLRYKKVFETIILSRGKIEEPKNTTIYGLKTLIFNILDEIDENIKELNNNIIALRIQIGTTVEENNEMIKTLLTTIQEYIKLEIDMNKINENKPDDIKLQILMNYSGGVSTILKDNVLELYQTTVTVNEDYKIKEIPELFNLLKIIEDFKITKNNIVQIYNNIDIFYNNLDEEYEDLPTYKTLYDIFFYKRNTYEERLEQPHKLFEDFKKPYLSKNQEKLQKKFNMIFKPLPLNDPIMQDLNKNKIKDLENIKDSQNNLINLTKYEEKYSKLLNKYLWDYKSIKLKIIFSKKTITNICKTKIIVEEYKKNINKFIQTAKFDMNTYKAQKKSKNLENLPLNYRKGIEDFLNIHKINFSIISKYLTDYTYDISNNSYNIITKYFNIFINSVIGGEDILIDDLDLLNIFFTMKNCFFKKEKDFQSIDDFIVIIYSLCISVLAEKPKEMLDVLFYTYESNSDVKTLFDTVFHNKLYIYKTKNINIQTSKEEKQNNLKIISSIEEIVLSDHSLNKNNITQTKNKLNNLKEQLTEELKKERFVNIRKKLLLIQKFIGHEKTQSDINILKLTTNRGNYSIIEKYFKNVEKMNIINFSSNINNIIDMNKYYSIKNNETNNTYCINLDSNSNYQCGPCDNTNRNPLLKIRSPSCPENLPYNLDTYIDSHINSELGFNKDTYRIMSFISEPNKELIYRNNSALKYGKKRNNDSYVWEVNKSYKSYTLLEKTDKNEDETIIIKSCLNNDTDHIKTNYDITAELDKIDKNENEFYLNNFYIENILLEDLKKEEWIKFPNSHQLYIEKPTKANFYYIYFIENDIKYYMYLHIKKNKSYYDIIFRENTSRYKEPFILNNAKWRFIRTEDYIDNIFEDANKFYNIRSKIYFNKSLNPITAPHYSPPHKIRGLLAKDNTCDNYATLLNDFFNTDEDLRNNTKFKFEGYNNNYKITPYIKSKNSIFNNIDGCLFLNYNIEQKKLYQQKLKNKEITQEQYDTKINNSKINKKEKLDPSDSNPDPAKKLVYYKIQNPDTLKYLYLDTVTNKVIWSDLYDENNKNPNYKITDEDILPDNFLWIVQDSKYNNIQINKEISKKQAIYNKMINQSLVNINKNITQKISNETMKNADKYMNSIKNNETFKNINEKILNEVKKATQNTTEGMTEEKIKEIQKKYLKQNLKGGEIISMEQTKIDSINNLVKKLKFIKYNDYKLLLNQLNIIKQISKNTLPSRFGYNNILNRMKLKYIDAIAGTPMTMYIYFTQMNDDSSKFECNIKDILNFRSLEFYAVSNSSEEGEYDNFDFNSVSVEVDNNTLPEKNIKINNTNNKADLINNRVDKNNILIQFNSTGNQDVEIAQIIINLPDMNTELIINNTKSDVFVYYNSKPIFNKGKWLKPIRNTYKNTTLNLLSNYGLNKKNKKIYDFSIRLQNTGSKINNINKEHITEYIKSFNNEVDSFYIKKNELEEQKFYTSKIFYIANNNQVIYIKIYNSNNVAEIYEAPCNYSSILEKTNPAVSPKEIFSFICKSIYTHIQVSNRINKSANISKIFDYITILYKNNKYNKLNEVLNISTRTNNNKYLLDISNKELSIEINMIELNQRYDLTLAQTQQGKIPDIITLVFDRLINEPGSEGQYIYANMKYTDFIHISNLFRIIPNIPFLKLNEFTPWDDENDASRITTSKIYNKFINIISEIIKTFIIPLKTNTTPDAPFEDIIKKGIINITNEYFLNYKGNEGSEEEKNFNRELKLYLNTLLNSNISITYYIIDLILDICHKIQGKYDTYAQKINELLKQDNRFIDCIYKPGSFIDILYNMVNYFSDSENETSPFFYNISYGFHFKRNNNEIYTNYIEGNKNEDIIQRKFIISFSDIIKNYKNIEPNLPEKNIRNKELNEPYIKLEKEYNMQVIDILKTVLNMKYANIKINTKEGSIDTNTNIQKKLKTILKTNLGENNFINYNNIDFNKFGSSKTFNKGDVILFKFIRNTQTNNLFNIINLYLPYKGQNNNWRAFTEIIDINYKYQNLSEIINTKLNIYGIAKYNEIFKFNIIESYKSKKELLLKQILPFKNDYSSVEVENICYIKLENRKLYLYLNKYRYEIKMRKLINSNLYLIYKTIHNINYYLEYIKKEDIYNYEWVKEEPHLVDRLINKLLFIDNTKINVVDTKTKIDITNEKMIEVEYLNRFSASFSHINNFINNGDGECNLEKTYFTIQNKTYKQIIHNDNILEILDITLNNSGNNFILKDKYGEIKQNIGNYKYYFTNEACNSYIIYSPSHNSDDMIVLNNNFEFEKIPNNTISISDLINNPTVNSKYIINLKYSRENNNFEELDENCIKRDKGKKLLIQDISDIEQIADKNRYFIYIINEETGINKGIIDDYYIKENENIPEKQKACYIIPIKPISKLKILEKTTEENKYIDLNLSLKPIATDSDYYVIQNKKGEYLRAKTLIQYKKPLRITLEFVRTNTIDSTYLFTIKQNIENVKNINILKTNKQCLTGGQKIISTEEIKKEYLKNINKNFNANSNFNDLCSNNTYVSFINYTNIETQPDVNYFDCRKKCDEDSNCSGFSVTNVNGKNACKTWEKKNDNSILFYDCNRILTNKNEIGEIKKKNKNNETTKYYNIDLINNGLYFIECKKKEIENKNQQEIEKQLYIKLDKSEITNTLNNKLECSKIEDINKETIYSNYIFRLNINKNSIENGNIKFYSILSDNKLIIGSYKSLYENAKNIEITYDSTKNKFIWWGDGEKWYLEKTNDIYEYIVLESIEDKEKGSNGFYCKYYSGGYKTMKVTRNNTEITIEGPNLTAEMQTTPYTYTRIIPDEDRSIFKNVQNLSELGSTINEDYEGNIFLMNNSKNNGYYNLFTIFDKNKYYLYLDTSSNNLIKFIKDNKENAININKEEFLWKFNLYDNEKNKGYSFQILKGGKLINQDILMRKMPEDYDSGTVQKTNKNREFKGGVILDNLINGNSYYIKSKNNEYICANKYYKKKDEDFNNIMAISIDSKLATYPNKISEYKKKFVRASIDLSDTNYNIFKRYKIDDDIMWKLIIEKDQNSQNKSYRFYNIKHDLYLKINNKDLFIIKKTNSSVFYNITDKNSDNFNITIDNTEVNDDKIYNLSLENLSERNLWAFINPTNYKNKNPYKTQNVFASLENGKIYRIINEGVKNNNETNTYLTINDLNNELLIPYNETTFTNKLEDDFTLWRCIINEDKTYSFELVKTGQRLGDDSGNLFKNIGNTLNFKKPEYTIDKKYLTDKFYIQHSTNEYYNIINSKNLNYNVCGFSNDINTYDNYSIENIKYTHKIANNSEWLITSKLYNEYTKSDIFSNESYYYLYPSKTKQIHYSFAKHYNTIYNTIYNEKTEITTNSIKTKDPNKALLNVIDTNSNAFLNKNGFTIETEIECRTIPSRKLGLNNISIILDTPTHFYTIRFINYSKDSTLIRIIENINTDKNNILTKNKEFNKLDKNGDKIDMKICAPDIYTDKKETNLFYLDKATLHLTYDNEFVNIYLNNKLITFFRKINLSITQIYYTSFYDCIWRNIKWWKHNTLINIPLWKTENINNFVENTPGIRFISKINKDVKFECYVKKHSENYFYIINNKNQYLSLIGTNQNDLNYKTEWTTDSSNDNCLWKLYDTNINLAKNINIIEGTPTINDDLQKHSFKCLKNSLSTVANIEDNTYLEDINNSTNIMVKAKINKTTKLVDETSDYTYSIIDINPDENNNNYKKCYWTHNQNGHTSIDYGSYEIGSHFTTDLWNIEYVLGVEPSIGDKFLVKYKSNKGIIRIDKIVNLDYPEYGFETTTVQARWLEWDKIKEFPMIKAQNNIYIEKHNNTNIQSDNICISKNVDSDNPTQFTATCNNVVNRIDCNNPPESMKNMQDSVERLYFEDRKCDDFMFKNYALIKASVPNPNNNVLSGGTKKQEGGNMWITKDSKDPDPNKKERPWFFYIDSKKNDKSIFTNIHNIEYFPSFNPPLDASKKAIYDKEVQNWTYEDTSSKNIILNRILNDFKYDGYIEKTLSSKIDENGKTIIKGIIRGVILPENFVLFYKTSPPDEDTPDGYIGGDFKSYNCKYKNIFIIKPEDYTNSSKYSKYYVTVETKVGNTLQKKDTTNNILTELNKCNKFVNNRICIPDGTKSITASNIIETNYLLQNENILEKPSTLLNKDLNTSEILSTNHPFRIINIYGKYLCDIFINNSHFCEYDNPIYNNIKSSEIIFQGQANSINLNNKQTHYIHNTSLESLWTFEKVPNVNSYRIINTYTGRYLTTNLLNSTNYTDSTNEIAELYVEFSQSKYFKQQYSDIKKNQSSIFYTYEDLYNIYYFDKNRTRMYLSFKDILINNTYTNSSKYGFVENKPTPFIIKPASRNLDQITDETTDLPDIINNICYNKTKVCIKNKSDIPLFENNNLQCLNISYLFRRSDSGSKPYTNYNQYDIFNLINKNNDNFLSVPHEGYYDLMFYFPNIKIKEIKFKFSGLFKPIDYYAEGSSQNSEVRFFNINDYVKDGTEFLFKDINNIFEAERSYPPTTLSIKTTKTKTNPYFIVENIQISKEQIIKIDTNNQNSKDSIVQFKIYCKEGFTLNYVEAYGEALGGATFKTEREVINKSINNFKQINLDKSLISATQNIKLNTIKIKYIKNSKKSIEENKNPKTNNVYIKNNKPIIDNLYSTDFILIFNPLLNAYMFYIDNNKFLSVDNVSYFKLIKNTNDTSRFNKSNENIYYYLQSLHDSKLYININNSKLILGNSLQLFQLSPTTTVPDYSNYININKSISNNILYNLDDRIIYIQQNDVKKFYHLIINPNMAPTLNKKLDVPEPLLLKRSGINEWQLTPISPTVNSKDKYIITDLSVTNNVYKFNHKNGASEEQCYINLYYDYSTLNIRTHSNIKKLLSHNDINKKIRLTNDRHGTVLKRNKDYVNRKSILDEIYLHNIIKLQYGNKYLSYSTTLALQNESNNNELFIQIDIGDFLCKIWHVVEKKFVVYNTLTDKFTVSQTVTEYNEIDVLNDIDLQNNTEFSIFERNKEDRNGKILYTLAYYKLSGKSLHLNVSNPEVEILYNSFNVYKYLGDYKNITNIDKNPMSYRDYCKICKSTNSVGDNLIEGKIYSIEEKAKTMFLSLGDYKMTIIGADEQEGEYFKISNLEIDKKEYLQNVPIQDYKESEKLKKLFNVTDNTTVMYLKMYIVTVSISKTNYNIIIWTNESKDQATNIKTIGRFEDKFDKPSGNYTGSHNIVHDANNNILEELDNKSYVFTTYVNKPPAGVKYIQISNMNFDLIEKYKLSLFHRNNSLGEDTEVLTIAQNTKKENTKKLITTCAWGECKDDLEKIPMKTAQNFLKKMNELESTYDYRLLGGKLDSNMIHFIKNVSKDLETPPNYHNKINLFSKYVNPDTSLYTSGYLLDILFKKNDIIEFYKIFGNKGWTNSHNSIYSKSLFTINKNIEDITELDYYDSFRNIYPVSWLEKNFARNVENMWTYNYWFEDNPHFRSLPNWKFELVQAIETRNSDTILKINFGGNNLNNNLSLCNFIRNPIIIFIIIIIGILLLKHFKLF